jgi:hypothetical protein
VPRNRQNPSDPFCDTLLAEDDEFFDITGFGDVGATAEFNRDALPFFVVDVREDGVEGDSDADDADRVGILFFKDSANAADCFSNVERDVFPVHGNISADVLGANVFDFGQLVVCARFLPHQRGKSGE